MWKTSRLGKYMVHNAQVNDYQIALTCDRYTGRWNESARYAVNIREISSGDVIWSGSCDKRRQAIDFAGGLNHG